MDGGDAHRLVGPPDSPLVVTETKAINFAGMMYEPGWNYEGGFQFKKHYFGPKPGELKEKRGDGKPPKLQLVPMAEALAFWKDDLWSYPGTRRLSAGTRHNGIFSEFVTALGLCGCEINDVWLAALAIEHRATLVSTDQGFARFPGLSWINPVNSL